RVDSQRFMQVLANLLSNAMKYSPEDDTVEIGLTIQGSTVRISVSDHGPGIPKAFLGRIFQKFSQADSSDTRQKGGTGLGLAITKELVERMGGSVGFTSEEGQGACFYVDFPLHDSITLKSTLPRPTTDAIMLMVVEDNQDVAELLSLMLTRAGFIVTTVHNSDQALKVLNQEHYAAMILDLMLPNISWLELIHQIRQQPETVQLPIIAISAKIEGGHLTINGDNSVIEWLPKPIDHQIMLSVIDRLISTANVSQPQVLHVNNDAELHHIICTMVKGDCTFVHAPTLVKAHVQLSTGHFDVILLDIKLPDGYGWDLLPMIRHNQPQAQILVLFSGTAISQQEAKVIEATLLKSYISPRQLLDTIRRLVNSENTVQKSKN
ncbi:hypothetical protein TI05_14550, partial [Achromatium sp. WMS3]